MVMEAAEIGDGLAPGAKHSQSEVGVSETRQSISKSEI